MVQFITLTLVSLSFVLLLMTKLRHNIVKVLWIHKHEPQASEYWRQFAFYFNKSLEKGAVKKHFAFQKETTNKRTRLRWRNKVVRAVSGNSRDGACFIFFCFRQTNVPAKNVEQRRRFLKIYSLKFCDIFGRIFTFIVF